MRVLVIDDEDAIRRALDRFFTEQGYTVVTASSVTEGLRHAAEQPIDVAVVDLVMADVDGVEGVRRLRQCCPDVVAIIMTGFGTIQSAVEAMKAGAFHYVTKPFELEDLARVVATGLELRTLKVENRILKQQLRERYRLGNMIGQSEAMQRVFSLIEKVAATDSTVLILGESGTGKELVARAIHYNSRRAERPLITVNCAAIPEELLETELFGHVKGAFTGAAATHQGKFAAAHGGTIFLDEIGDMSMKLQVKILRVLQERRFEPVGSSKVAEVDVRIIAATNQELERAVKERRFREDLYYRLNVIPVKLPPLRDRRSDIPLLVNHFVKAITVTNNSAVKGVTDTAMRVLMRHYWPGNVRELEHAIERMVVLKGEGMLGLEDLPPALQQQGDEFRPPEPLEIPDAGLSLRHAVSAFEDALIRRALEKSGGNKNRAAGLLKLNRTTLVEKIKKKRLEVSHV